VKVCELIFETFILMLHALEHEKDHRQSVIAAEL
jgi:hypothetical protein